MFVALRVDNPILEPLFGEKPLDSASGWFVWDILDPTLSLILALWKGLLWMGLPRFESQTTGTFQTTN